MLAFCFLLLLSPIPFLAQSQETTKIVIQGIKFLGNTVVTDNELRQALRLKGLDRDHLAKRLQHQIDVYLLEEYRERGYVAAKATARVEMEPPDPSWSPTQACSITILVEEGGQYRYGTFEIEGIKKFDVETVQAIYNIQPDEVVNYKALKRANETLKKLYSWFGYIDMNMTPIIDVDPQTRIVDVQLSVVEGKSYIVDRIHFEGNTRTRDKVMRQVWALREQTLFQADLLELSIQRLNQLGIFEEIQKTDYAIIKRPERAEVDVLVRVRELEELPPRGGAALTGLPQGPSPSPGACAPGYFLPPPWGSSQLRRSGNE